MPIFGDYLERPTYEVLQTISGGNVGLCRRAKHSVFNIDVVQKTISLLNVPDGVANEPCLLKEAKHDHLIKVWEAQWEPDPKLKSAKAVTFICDYYPGGSVYDALSEGHDFGLAGAMKICGQMLDALAYLHENRGYVHRDIKPANILLDESRENATLTDLGSAGRINSQSGTAPNYGGTPLYLAPEAKPTGYVSPRSDLFSLGITTVEILRGAFPYEQIRPSDVDLRLSAGKRALPDSLYGLPPCVPSIVRRFVSSLVQVDPMKRPGTARLALVKLNALRYVDWQRKSGEGLLGDWVGSWPMRKIAEKSREYRVHVTEVARGSRAGQLRFAADWRKPDGSWRTMSKLTCYASPEDARALASFFRKVEATAQSVAS